jgi:hypothetical protein
MTISLPAITTRTEQDNDLNSVQEFPMKVLRFFALWFFSLSAASAGTLEELKDVPASKYEIGKLKLSMLAFEKSIEFNQREVGQSGFVITQFRTEEFIGHLLLVASMTGDSKDVNKQTCQELLEAIRDNINFTDIVLDLWNDLTGEQLIALKQEVLLKAELFSKTNQNIKVDCR